MTSAIQNGKNLCFFGTDKVSRMRSERRWHLGGTERSKNQGMSVQDTGGTNKVSWVRKCQNLEVEGDNTSIERNRGEAGGCRCRPLVAQTRCLA